MSVRRIVPAMAALAALVALAGAVPGQQRGTASAVPAVVTAAVARGPAEAEKTVRPPVATTDLAAGALLRPDHLRWCAPSAAAGLAGGVEVASADGLTGTATDADGGVVIADGRPVTRDSDLGPAPPPPSAERTAAFDQSESQPGAPARPAVKVRVVRGGESAEVVFQPR
ncbi:hypothetical protein [Azospirillum sp. ST 5-10]|uniref:hypothetical protein n=1 Tax=unclassified Azospirillum TaxID=2630922 RepID=UPI003F49F6C0